MQNGSMLWIALAALFLNSTRAESQDPRPLTKTEKRPRPDAGDLICERVSVIGSRIEVKTVCMTRLEWQEKKTLDREFMERLGIPVNLRDGD